jgi:hypothetical protein
VITTDERVEKSVRYLAETDREHARLKAEYKAKDALTKTILAYEFNDAVGSGEVRKAISYASDSYLDHINDIKDLEIELQTMYNKRDTERLIIDLYRTECANSRKGNI